MDMDNLPPHDNISVVSDGDDGALGKSHAIENPFPCPYLYRYRSLSYFRRLVKREKRQRIRLVDACCFPLYLTSKYAAFGSIAETERHLHSHYSYASPMPTNQRYYSLYCIRRDASQSVTQF
jgi:hypothetical protein